MIHYIFSKHCCAAQQKNEISFLILEAQHF